MTRPRKEPLDPDHFDLKLTLRSPLHTLEPSEYVTSGKGRMFFEDENGESHLAGRVAVTLYDLRRAEAEGQNLLEVFDCLSEAALELYQELFHENDLRKEVRAIVGDVLTLSLLVIETIEVMPAYRGGGLGLAVVLKLMQILGTSAGMAALLAAPLNRTFWHPQMNMEQFPADCPAVRQKLGKYWEQLGFKPLGDSGIYLHNLENLPRISALPAMQS